jgi:hypothetical protein
MNRALPPHVQEEIQSNPEFWDDLVKQYDIEPSRPKKTIDQNEVILAKSKNPSYQRLTVYLTKSVHRKLKVKAIESDREMSEIIEDLVESFLDKEGDRA